MFSVSSLSEPIRNYNFSITPISPLSSSLLLCRLCSSSQSQGCGNVIMSMPKRRTNFTYTHSVSVFYAIFFIFLFCCCCARSAFARSSLSSSRSKRAERARALVFVAVAVTASIWFGVIRYGERSPQRFVLLCFVCCCLCCLTIWATIVFIILYGIVSICLPHNLMTAAELTFNASCCA